MQGELLRRLGDEKRETLLRLYNQRLRGDQKPVTWETPNLIWLQKNQGASWIKDFRPITISLVIARVYDRMLLEFLLPYCQSWSLNQFGNRKTYQCSEAVHVLRRLIEQTMAFQSARKLRQTWRGESLWQHEPREYHTCVAETWGSELVDRCHYGRIWSNKCEIGPWRTRCWKNDIRRGVRQGSPLRAMLFQLTLDYCMKPVLERRKNENQFGMDISWRNVECASGDDLLFSEKIFDLSFADDMTLITVVFAFCAPWLSLDSHQWKDTNLDDDTFQAMAESVRCCFLCFDIRIWPSLLICYDLVLRADLWICSLLHPFRNYCCMADISDFVGDKSIGAFAVPALQHISTSACCCDFKMFGMVTHTSFWVSHGAVNK